MPQLHRRRLPAPDAAAQPSKRAKKGGAAGQSLAPVEGPPLWARQVVGEGAYVKRWRIIIRNLPFQAVHLPYLPDATLPPPPPPPHLTHTHLRALMLVV